MLRSALTAVMALPVCLSTTLLPGRALALSEQRHYELTARSCADHGLPPAFCDRMGVRSHNADDQDWWTMPAHGQTADGLGLCDGANMVVQFVLERGSAARQALVDLAQAQQGGNADAAARATERVAVEMGRVFHAVADNCTHRGITNPQHAWLTLRERCDGTHDDPDGKPASLACARGETDAVMDRLVDTLGNVGVTGRDLSVNPLSPLAWAPRGEVCEYFRSAKEWDGRDLHWDLDVMAGALRDAVRDGLGTDGLGTDGAVALDVCAQGPERLVPVEPVADVDTSGEAPWCPLMQVRCLAAELDPPAPDGALQGCTAASAGPGEVVALVLVVGLVRGRRRR